MAIGRSLLTAALAVQILIVAPVGAQEDPTPSPRTCPIGVICQDVGRELEQQERLRIQVSDPPGEYVRSLISISAIVSVVVAYLFFALTGMRPPFPRRKAPAA